MTWYLWLVLGFAGGISLMGLVFVCTMKKLDKTVAALKRLKLEFDVVHCGCGKSWTDTDGHDIVCAALAEIREGSNV